MIKEILSFHPLCLCLPTHLGVWSILCFLFYFFGRLTRISILSCSLHLVMLPANENTGQLFRFNHFGSTLVALPPHLPFSVCSPKNTSKNSDFSFFRQFVNQKTSFLGLFQSRAKFSATFHTMDFSEE